MYIVPEDAIPDLITLQDAYTAVEQAFSSLAEGTARNFPVIREALGYKQALFGFKSGFDRKEEILGFKAGGYWPENTDHNISCHQSSILLFDPDTGRLEAVIGGNYLTALRTAAATAVSVKHLSRQDARVLGVIGAGAQAAHQIRAVCEVRQIEEVFVWNRTRSKVADLAETLSDIGVSVKYAEAENIGAWSDIIITIASSHESLFPASYARPGTHFSCMGTDTRGKQEVDTLLLSKADIFADEIEQAVSIGEAQHAFAQGLLKKENITSLGDVIVGTHGGRRDDTAITLFDGTGFALQDLVVARVVLARAAIAGKGIKV